MHAGAGMSNLRLGAINLEPKDVAYIRALVRLFSHTEKLGWAFAEVPPYHAVVADRRGRAAQPSFFERFQGPILTLVEPPGVPEADTVAYPIHANQFRDWLKLRQEALLRAVYREREPAVDAGGVLVRGADPDLAAVAGRSFKLRRWPAPSVLQGDPLHMRIATLMSRNALSVARLADLTGQPEAACLRFVATLHKAGLLKELVAVGAAQGTAADARTVPAIEVPPARRGLMASLRRHLGL
jgi:hypothetical protein